MVDIGHLKISVDIKKPVLAGIRNNDIVRIQVLKHGEGLSLFHVTADTRLIIFPRTANCFVHRRIKSPVGFFRRDIGA